MGAGATGVVPLDPVNRAAPAELGAGLPAAAGTRASAGAPPVEDGVGLGVGMCGATVGGAVPVRLYMGDGGGTDVSAGNGAAVGTRGAGMGASVGDTVSAAIGVAVGAPLGTGTDSDASPSAIFFDSRIRSPLAMCMMHTSSKSCFNILTENCEL